jgi:DNA-binding GntR family transcriptional regulator
MMSELPLVEIAYQAMRQKLLIGEYLPGTLLSENDLAGELKMSRTPMHTAIVRLEKEGFLETLKKRGILVKEINFKEMFDLIDFLNALYLYALAVIEQERYEINLEVMKEYLDALVEASKEKRYRDYYENGLLLMRTLLATIENQCILDTFDAYKDKLLFFVVATRIKVRQNQPYSSIKLYADIYEYLSTRNFTKAKKTIEETKHRAREQLVRG